MRKGNFDINKRCLESYLYEHDLGNVIKVIFSPKICPKQHSLNLFEQILNSSKESNCECRFISFLQNGSHNT